MLVNVIEVGNGYIWLCTFFQVNQE